MRVVSLSSPGARCLCFAWSLVVLDSGCSQGGHKDPAPGQAVDLAAHEQGDGGGEGATDGGTSRDAALPDGGDGDDLAMPALDLTAPIDLTVPPDLSPLWDLSPSPDLSFPTVLGIDIYVDNRCRMDVVPTKVDVPRGVTPKLTYINRSRDYAVDVWLSYGGGFLDLRPGMSWSDRFEHCRLGTRPYSAFADISTACSKHRLMINCL